MANEKKCVTCQLVKAVDRFYKNSAYADGHANDCIDCYTAKRRRRDEVAREVAGSEGEQAVINRLRALGIYAAPGKCSEWRWVDVVAWGCVRIEVKLTRPDRRGAHQISFQAKQRERGLQADLVALVCADLEGYRFYLFPANDPIFYLGDGRLKSGIRFNESAFAKHRDCFSLIGDAVNEVSLRLKG